MTRIFTPGFTLVGLLINTMRRSLFYALLLLSSTSGALAQSPTELGYRLKAVYLLNFLRFTEWPDSAFKDENSPIVVGIFGEDPFGRVLNEVIESEQIGEHPIILRRFKTFDEITHCHAVFFSPLEHVDARALIDRVGSSAILVVGDGDEFAETGGSVGFYVEKNKVRFTINMQALKRADLKVSSKLLRLARLINPS